MSIDPIGKSAGSVSDPDMSGLSNSYPTISDTPIDAMTNRVQPRQVSTGMTRGTHVTEGADGKPQVLVGNQSTFGNGLYVAKPGYDVITNTDPANLIFNSNQNAFKIVDDYDLSLSFTLPTTGYYLHTTTVNHGLNYTPAYLAYIQADTALTDFGFIAGEGAKFQGEFKILAGSVSGLMPIIYMRVYVDDTKFSFIAETAGIADTGPFPTYTNSVKIYALQETFG